MKHPTSENSKQSDHVLTLSRSEGRSKGRLKNQQWVKKKGISPQAFGTSKLQGAYNPHLIKKQKELYRNAKLIKKFKKSVKQQNSENSMLQGSMPEIGDIEIELDGDGQEKQIRPANQERGGLDGDVKQKQIQPIHQEQRKRKKTLQSVREEYEKRRVEEEKVKMEREAIAKARQEERERAAMRRKDLRGKMFKKTRFGQPVMKFRIQHMLESIAGIPDK